MGQGADGQAQLGPVDGHGGGVARTLHHHGQAVDHLGRGIAVDLAVDGLAEQVERDQAAPLVEITLQRQVVTAATPGTQMGVAADQGAVVRDVLGRAQVAGVGATQALGVGQLQPQVGRHVVVQRD